MEENYAWSDMGRRLRRLIGLRGETLRQFADRSSIPYRTLQNHVAGKIAPNAEQFKKLAEAGINLNFILTGKGVLDGRIVEVEDAFILQSDPELSKIIDCYSHKVMDETMRELASSGVNLNFRQLFQLFMAAHLAIFQTVLQFEATILQARQKGVPISDVLPPIIEIALKLAAHEVISLLRRPVEEV